MSGHVRRNTQLCIRQSRFITVPTSQRGLSGQRHEDIPSLPRHGACGNRRLLFAMALAATRWISMVFAAYGGVYIGVAIIWLWVVNGIHPLGLRCRRGRGGVGGHEHHRLSAALRSSRRARLLTPQATNILGSTQIQSQALRQELSVLCFPFSAATPTTEKFGCIECIKATMPSPIRLLTAYSSQTSRQELCKGTSHNYPKLPLPIVDDHSPYQRSSLVYHTRSR